MYAAATPAATGHARSGVTIRVRALLRGGLWVPRPAPLLTTRLDITLAAATSRSVLTSSLAIGDGTALRAATQDGWAAAASRLAGPLQVTAGTARSNGTALRAAQQDGLAAGSSHDDGLAVRPPVRDR